MPTKVSNWPDLEKMYVVDGKTHREIARLAGLSNSTVSAKARTDDWEGKRVAYKSALARRGYEAAAEAVGHEQEAVLRENLIISRAYLRSFAQQLSRGEIKTNAKDAIEFMRFLVDQFDAAKGEGLKDGPKVIEGSAVVTGGNEEFLRRVVELARSRVDAPGGLGADPVGEPPGTLPN